MKLFTEPYDAQKERWPQAGRVILAQFDADRVVVYQAYNRAIGGYAAEHGRFGGDFKFSRMSWVKPNFLWMMYRSGWGTKPDQEVTLALHLRRSAFDEILARAVHSSFVPEVYGSHEAWQTALASSEVRLQWDPDHSPVGSPLERRAIQLGLRGSVLRRFAGEWLLDVEDVSGFVLEQREHVEAHDTSCLLTPREHAYPVSDPAVAARLGVSFSPAAGDTPRPT